ncbi:MAG TPA: 50S ribosomal protein L5 [Candidatus Nanoarchaeia archaeon]|nr:50S ribosomal protein L5 [Candidatus Nanoarchaeia archaeon]
MKQQLAQKTAKKTEENPMRSFFIEKVVLSVGGTEEDLKKGTRLIEILSGMKAQVIMTAKRIPDFDVRPGLEVGARTTIRGKAALDILTRLLGAIDNQLSKKQISDNHFSFGIKEYIEIPGMEYQRDIGIRGLNVTVVFARAGLRVKRKKIKQGKVSKKQLVSKEDIIQFMKKTFNTEVI